MSFDATNNDRSQSEERIAAKSMYNQSYMVHSHRNTTISRNWLICVKNRDAAIDAMYVECKAEIRSRDKAGPCLRLF